MKVITRKAIQEHYDMSEIARSIEQSYEQLGKGNVESHERHFIKTKDGGDFMFTAATNFQNEVYLVRGSTFMPWNKGTKIPVVTGAYTLTNFSNGEILAIVDGTLIITLRTGAKSAVAAKYLAKKNSKTLGLIGLGAQAQTQAEAIASQFELEEIIGYTRNPEAHTDTINYIKAKTNTPFEVKRKEEVIEKSDILVVGTFSDTPLVSYNELHAGQLVISLAHKEEVATNVVENAKVYVDYKPEAKTTFGPVKAAMERGYDLGDVKGDLSELASGAVKGRESDEEIIYFQSLGVTIEDLATVEYLYEKLESSAQEISLSE